MKKYAIVALVAGLALSAFGSAALADTNSASQASSSAAQQPADQNADQNSADQGGDAATSDQSAVGDDADSD